ncbi:MAG: hypothetical protein WBX00_15775 [Isosphaeraceae bacterium]|jgi:hypothetical protein
MATAAMAANEVLARVADVASCDLLDFIDVDEKGGVKVDLKLANRRGLGHLIKRLRINKDGIQDSFHRDVANRGGGDRFRPTDHYSAAITACDSAQPTGNRGGIPGYRYVFRRATCGEQTRS